ncbi:filamentous hemagglutinin N-terminal domain-containing protein, partial [bacterium]
MDLLWLPVGKAGVSARGAVASRPLMGCRGGLYSAIGLFFSCVFAHANPVWESIRVGSAEFVRSGDSLLIKQSTEKLILDWRDFSIGEGELTHFIQPGSNAAALNRVLGGNPSAIYGSLRSNGKIYLINPNGVFIGPSCFFEELKDLLVRRQGGLARSLRVILSPSIAVLSVVGLSIFPLFNKICFGFVVCFFGQQNSVCIIKRNFVA